MYKDKNSAFRTQSLFLETNLTTFTPPFTLKEVDYEKDGIEYISMKRLYLSYDDPTEWEFAMSVLGSWKHWQKLLGNKMIRAHIDEWREELEIKLRSNAIKQIVKQSKNKDSAAKWLAEGSWKGKRGRPTKQEVERERKVQAGIEQDLDHHWERLMNQEAPAKVN